MTDAVYEWKNNYFCEGDIVGALTMDKPWSAWIDAGGNPDSGPGEELLDVIADYFNLNRNDSRQLRREGFPLRYTTPQDQPVFCSTCLEFFSINI